MNLFEYNEESKNLVFDATDILNNGEILVIGSFITKGQIIFDIGCGIGNWSMIVESHKPFEHIYMIDPNVDKLKIANEHFFIRKNVSLHNMAVTNKDEKGMFYLYGNNDPFAEKSSLFRRTDLEEKLVIKPKEIEVNQSSLDCFLNMNGIDVVNFMKIDAEGSLFDILDGAKDYLKNQDIEIIQFHYNDSLNNAGYKLKEVYDLLASNNYSLYRIIPNGLVVINEYLEELETAYKTNYIAISSRKYGELDHD